MPTAYSSRASRSRRDHDTPPPKFPIGFFLLLLIFIFFFASCTKLFLGKEAAPEDPLAYNPITLEPKEPSGMVSKLKQLVLQKEATLDGEKKDRINFLALGQGGPGHDGPYLTDTIILGSFKPSTGQIAMIPIPRDVAVEIPDYGIGKINYVNAYGEMQERGSGPEMSKEVIEDLFDLDIHYYARVDFTAFTQAIDAIGGVSIAIDRSFTDYEYPAANYQYQTIYFQKGVELMDGERALQFARSRHGTNGEASDFARSKRQQKVIVSLKEKVLSFDGLTNPVWVKNMIDIFRDHVVTNVGFSDIMQMLRIAKEFNTNSIITLTLDSSEEGYLLNSSHPKVGFILEPKTGNFKDIKKAIKEIFETPPDVVYVNTPTQQAPPATVPEPKLSASPTEQKTTAASAAHANIYIEVQNATWRAGMAARVQKTLQTADFYVPAIGNSAVRPLEKSVIYIADSSTEATQAAAENIARLLDISIQKTIPNDITKKDTTDILILLGENFQE